MPRALISSLIFGWIPVVAAAATAAIPLNLPPGWVANPALAKLSPIVWARSGSGGAESLSAIALPSNGLPSSAQMDGIRARLVPANTPVWKTQATLCGAPGIVAAGHSSGPLPYTEFVVEESHSTLYLFAYLHVSPGGDAQTEAFIRAACPASASALPSLVPPAGWTAKTLVENVAGWQTEGGDSVVLATTSLAEAAQLSVALKSAPNSDAKPQTFTACSGIGLQFEEQGTIGSQSAGTTAFVITTHETAYLIYYRHVRAADPSVVSAIRAFCPSDATPLG